MDEGDILNIEVSDDDAEVIAKKRADRTGQSETEFQAVKRDYQARQENGEIHEAVQVPFRSGMNKMRTQEAIHAVEELYFSRRYDKGIDLVNKAFEAGGANAIEKDSRTLLGTYREKCQRQLDLLSSEIRRVSYSAQPLP